MPNKTSILIYIPVVLLAVLFFYPIWVLLIYTFMPTIYTFGQIYPPQIPYSITFANIINSFKEVDLTGPLIRSVEVAFLVGAISLGLGIPAGYGMSKLPSRYSNKLIAFMFIVNMMPGLVIAIPISSYFISGIPLPSLHLTSGSFPIGFYIYKATLQNTVLGVALAQELVVLPLVTFIMVGAFRGLPKDLENQARVDGASLRSTFANILLPLVRVPIMIGFILAWMTSWDEFTYALIVAPIVPTYSTFPVALYNYVSRDLPIESAVFALLATLPIIVLVVIFQKYLKGQYLSGGLVG